MLKRVLQWVAAHRKHRAITYFWLMTIPSLLCSVITAYVMLSYGNALGDKVMIIGMKLKSAGMTPVVEDISEFEETSQIVTIDDQVRYMGSGIIAPPVRAVRKFKR